jgi:hypothetical protein
MQDNPAHLLVRILGFSLEFNEVLTLVGDLLGQLLILYLHLITLLLVFVKVFLQFLHIGLVALDLLNAISLSSQSLALLCHYSVPHLLKFC